MSIVHQPDQPDIPVALEARHRWVALLAEVGQLAHVISNTDFVPKAFRGNEAAIAAAILYGDEVGLSPMQSLAKIAVIDGRPAIAAEAQRALILAAGHDIWPDGESTVTRATVAGRRRDSPEVVRVTWTIDDAKRANLAGKSNWRNYPRQMLIARASAELARTRFADVIGGLAAVEELDGLAEVEGSAEVDTEGLTDREVEAAVKAPAAKTNRRRRDIRVTMPVVAAAPEPEPAEASLPPLPNEETPHAVFRDNEEADSAPALLTEPQRRKIHALFRDRGIDDRDDRMEYCRRVTGRTILGSKELTLEEASAVIEALAVSAIPKPAEAAQADAPAEPQLDLGLIDRDTASMLAWMRNEAGVDDAWVLAELARIGAPSAGPVWQAIRKLTSEQATQLSDALSAVIDTRREEAPA